MLRAAQSLSKGGSTSIVYIAGSVSRAHAKGGRPGETRVARTGGTAGALTVKYAVGGTAAGGRHYAALTGSVTIPAGMRSAAITVSPVKDANVGDEKTVVVTLQPGNANYHVGCPVAALVAIKND